MDPTVKRNLILGWAGAFVGSCVAWFVINVWHRLELPMVVISLFLLAVLFLVVRLSKHGHL